MANPFPANFEGLDGSRRLTGQVNFTDPANQPGGGGGGVTPVSAYVRLNNNAVVGDPVPWDTVEFDAGGYFDPVGHRFVIPAGKAGRHLVGVQLQVATTAATYVTAIVNNGGADANLFTGLARTNAPTNWAGCPSLLITCGVGDTLSVSVGFDVDPTATVAGGANGSVFWIVYLGTG